MSDIYQNTSELYDTCEISYISYYTHLKCYTPVMPYNEKHARSVAKSVSYRIISILADIVIIYFFTHKIQMTLGIVIISNFLSTFLYYFHERIWNKFHFGRKFILDKNI
jgi:uncharacterized membrane protein